MSRIRIRCRVSADGAPLGRIPDFCDLRIFAVADDGTEVEIHNVDHVVIDMVAGSEPIRATLTFMNVELDVEAELAAPTPLAAPLSDVINVPILTADLQLAGEIIETPDAHQPRWAVLRGGGPVLDTREPGCPLVWFTRDLIEAASVAKSMGDRAEVVPYPVGVLALRGGR